MTARTGGELELGELRGALASLRYEQPLGEESAALVGALLADLLHKDRELKAAAKALAASDALLEPLRHDNSGAHSENNQLHLELIRRAEEAASRERAHEGAKRALERENTNLRFVAAQQAERLRALERESDGLRAKAESALAAANLILPSQAQARKRAPAVSSVPPRCARARASRRRAPAAPARRARASRPAGRMRPRAPRPAHARARPPARPAPRHVARAGAR